MIHNPEAGNRRRRDRGRDTTASTLRCPSWPVGFRSTSTWSMNNQRCCSTRDSNRCLRSCARRSRGVVPVERSGTWRLTLRDPRVRRAQPPARRGPERGPGVGRVAAMVSVKTRGPRAPAARQRTTMRLQARVRWPTRARAHGWETGLSSRRRRATALRRPAHQADRRTPVTESDILGPSEAFRKPMEYLRTHSKSAGPILEALAATEPTTLACISPQRLARQRGRVAARTCPHARRLRPSRLEGRNGSGCRRSTGTPSGEAGIGLRPGRHPERTATGPGTLNRPGEPVDDGPTATTRPPDASTAAAASRVDLPVVKMSLTTTTGVPGSSANPRRSRRPCPSSRRTSPAIQPPRSRVADSRRRRARARPTAPADSRSRSASPSPPARRLRPHQEASALQVSRGGGGEPLERRKWPVRKGAVSSKSLGKSCPYSRPHSSRG